MPDLMVPVTLANEGGGDAAVGLLGPPPPPPPPPPPLLTSKGASTSRADDALRTNDCALLSIGWNRASCARRACVGAADVETDPVRCRAGGVAGVEAMSHAFQSGQRKKKKKTTTRGMRAGGFSDVKLATADVQQLVEQVPLLQPVTVGCSITSERSKHRQRPRSVMLCRTSRPCRSFRRLWRVPSTSSRSVGRSGSCTQGLTVVGCDTG